jgi:hypothetical protein
MLRLARPNRSANEMSTTKIKLLHVTSAAAVAFAAGCIFQSLSGEPGLLLDDMAITLGAIVAILAIVGAFALGERLMNALFNGGLQSDAERSCTQKASTIAIATTAWNAIKRLEDPYHDTPDDRMRLRFVYHSDTFGSLIEALASIPVYQFDSLETAMALAKLRRNMMEIQRLTDAFMEGRDKPEGKVTLFPELYVALDLSSLKTEAKTHYLQVYLALT